jgi:hypothetical protein
MSPNFSPRIIDYSPKLLERMFRLILSQSIIRHNSLESDCICLKLVYYKQIVHEILDFKTVFETTHRNITPLSTTAYIIQFWNSMEDWDNIPSGVRVTAKEGIQAYEEDEYTQEKGYDDSEDAHVQEGNKSSNKRKSTQVVTNKNYEYLDLKILEIYQISNQYEHTPYICNSPIVFTVRINFH